MIKFSPDIQISVSTAEESLNYFTGSEPRLHDADPDTAAMPSGTYRIVDDQLYQIIESPRSLRERTQKLA